MYRHTLYIIFICFPILTVHAQYGWRQAHPFANGHALTEQTLNDVHFTDRDHGFVVGMKGTVLRTTDGKNWNHQLLTYPDSIYGDLYAITSHDNNNLYAAGLQGMLYSSSDHGLTWNAQYMDACYDIGSLYFIPPNTIWAVGDSGRFGRTSQGRRGCIRKSTDLGQSWRTMATMDNWTFPDGGLFLRDMQFTSDDTGYVVGERGVILKTVDGGEHWDFLYTEQRTAFYSLRFFSNDEGFCAGDSRNLQYTNDGGATWTEIRNAGGYFTDIVFIDRERAFGCGPGIQQSTDGGVRWSYNTLSAELLPYFNAMCFVDQMEGWAVGQDGKIFHTESGGVVSATAANMPATVALQLHPQPLYQSITGTVTVSLRAADDIQLVVYDLLGRQVSEIFTGRLATGTHTFPLTLIPQRYGVHFLRLTGQNIHVVRSFLAL